MQTKSAALRGSRRLKVESLSWQTALVEVGGPVRVAVLFEEA
jgi:hypothetical protein